MTRFSPLGPLEVGDFREVTLHLLENHFHSSPLPDRKMLDLSYWAPRIEASRQSAPAAPRPGIAKWITAWWKEFALISRERR